LGRWFFKQGRRGTAQRFTAFYFTPLPQVFQEFGRHRVRVQPTPSPCVEDKIIKGKQMATAFCVDDCELSHKDPKVMDDMIK
jgi:hypothetical protein